MYSCNEVNAVRGYSRLFVEVPVMSRPRNQPVPSKRRSRQQARGAADNIADRVHARKGDNALLQIGSRERSRGVKLCDSHGFRFGQRPSSGGVLLFKLHAHRHAEDNDACEENNKGEVLSTQNLAEPNHEVTGNQVEQRPDYVHRWRGESLARRLGKRCRKAIATNAPHKMRNYARSVFLSIGLKDIGSSPISGPLGRIWPSIFGR
jgi:hypothetical protein